MTTLAKPLLSSTLKQKKRGCLSYLQARYKYVILTIVLICLLLNEKIYEVYQRQDFRIINIYRVENTTSNTSEAIVEPDISLETENDADVVVITDNTIDFNYGKFQDSYPPYSDDLLVEWEPAPISPGNPNEPGYLGAAPVIPESLKKIAQDTYGTYQMNVVASDLLPLNRTIKDSRIPECLSLKYPKKLPQTTVLINFQNEARSTLLRTVWSIYRKSPRALLKEIILIDDASTLEHLGKNLEDYVKQIPVRVRILRLKQRAGTTLAKLVAVKFVTTPTLVFMDAHTECNDGWLEPLLSRVAENRRAAITPVIEYISPQTFELKNYNDVNNLYGSFDWNLYFVWRPIPQRERDRNHGNKTGYIQTPEFAGGIFAIDTEFFLNIGGYDANMTYYGAENIEMSLRVWMCGGSIETMPCSRVGHLGRTNKPYSMPHGLYYSMMLNSVRVADVWLDEYKTAYYAIHPEAIEMRSDVTDRVELRNRLKCKSFKWYLENIFPETPLAQEYDDIGRIESISKKHHCIDAYPTFDKVTVSECRDGNGRTFMFVKNGQIVLDSYCLQSNDLDKPVSFSICDSSLKKQLFKYDNKTNTLQLKDGKNCVTLKDDKFITVIPCNGSLTQKWIFDSKVAGAKAIS